MTVPRARAMAFVAPGRACSPWEPSREAGEVGALRRGVGS